MDVRKENLRKIRGYYYGDRGALYAGFLSRFKEPDVSAPLSMQSFIFQNEIAAIVTKRMSLVPLEPISFSVLLNGDEHEELTKKLREWLAGPHFSDERGFADFLAEVLLALELDGEAALKMIVRKGVPLVRRIPGEALEIHTNPENVFEIEALEAQWSRTIESDEGAHEAMIREVIDSGKYVFERDGQTKKQTHPFGFIPAVLVRREDVEGSVHGRSGVADLMEPQDNLNRCLVNIARANKYGPWGLYCMEEAGLPLPDGDIAVTPGALVGAPIRKISGDGAAECLFREKEEVLDGMYRVAGLSRNKADEVAKSDRSSGKAMVILNAQGKRYVRNLLARLRRGIGQMCAKSLVMAGHVNSLDGLSVRVDFPELDAEDPSVQIQRATLLFEQGFTDEGLRALGYDDARIAQLVAGAKDKSNE